PVQPPESLSPLDVVKAVSAAPSASVVANEPAPGPCGPVAPVVPGLPCGPCAPCAPVVPAAPIWPIAPCGPWRPCTFQDIDRSCFFLQLLATRSAPVLLLAHAWITPPADVAIANPPASRSIAAAATAT